MRQGLPSLNIEYLDLRLFLEQEFESRSKKNPGYSLRAFARFLGIDHSRLSKILRSERKISKALAYSIADRFGFTSETLKKIDRQYGPTSDRRATSEKKLLQLPLEIFELISKVPHFAILETFKLKGFKSDAKWIATKLDLSLHETNRCLNRLEKLNLIDRSNPAQWKDRRASTSTHIIDKNITSIAHKKYQRAVLEGAIQALNEIPIEWRDQSSILMATSSSKLAEAKERITRFRRELCEFLEDCEEKDSVYQLSLSLYPLSNRKGKQE